MPRPAGKAVWWGPALPESAVRDVLGNGPVMMFVQDRDLRYIWASPGTSIGHGDVLGQTDFNLPQSPDVRALIEVKRRVLETGWPERTMFVSRVAGPSRSFDLHLTAIKGPEGTVRGLIGLCIDVTSQREISRALEESEHRLQLALRTAPVIIFTQDRHLRYTWVYNVQGMLPTDEIVGRSDDEFLNRAGWPALIAFKRMVLETCTGGRQIVGLELRGGETRWYDLTVEPARENNETVGITGIAVDITEQMQQRAELERARAEAEAARAEAERANLAKSRFLAAASHDLRQPFQAMRLFLHLLESRLTEPAQLDLARKLGEALDSGQGLLNALLEISALEAATVTPSITEFALGPVLRRLAEEFGPQATEKGLSLRAVPTAAMVRSDPVLLDRMLRNLVSNAIRHTGKGGILLGARRRGSRVLAVVCDTGCGIPLEMQDAIFDEFVQLRESSRDRRDGLGLGLAIVRRTGQLLDHPVGLRSIPGRGSCFSVSLPCVAAVAKRAEVVPGTARPGTGERLVVAVAEDDRLQLAALEAMLSDWGLVPVGAADANGLMKALEHGGVPPNMVVSDFRLPGDTRGPDLITQVRARYGAELPGLLLTGDIHPDTTAEAEAAGLTIVHKPVHPNRLRRALEAALGVQVGRR